MIFKIFPILLALRIFHLLCLPQATDLFIIAHTFQQELYSRVRDNSITTIYFKKLKKKA